MASDSEKASYVKYCAEKEVLASLASQDFPAIAHHITRISNLCLEERLISEKWYRRILHQDNKDKEKADLLSKALQRTMEDNKDGFELFLYALKKTGGCFEELVKQLKLSVEQTVERMHKAQATRRKRASPKALAIQAAILDNLEELTGACECLLTKMVSECQTKKIINRDTYQERAKTLKDKKSKTKWFLKCVCYAVRKENKKYETFLAVLNKHQSYRPIAQKIQLHVEASTSEMVATPSTGLPPSNQIVGIPAVTKPFSGNVDCSSTGVEDGAGACSSPPSVSTENKHGVQVTTTDIDSTSDSCRLRNSRRQEVEYQKRMEKQQNEAKEIDDLKKKNESLTDEKCQMLTEITQLKQKLTDKQNELVKIERDKEKLVDEVADLKFALKKAEKSEVVKTLKERIATKEAEIEEKNKKISKLEKEKCILQEELSERDKVLLETRQMLQETLQSLQEMQTFNRQQSQENQEMHRQNRKLFCYVACAFLILLLLLFIAVSFLFYLKAKH